MFLQTNFNVSFCLEQIGFSINNNSDKKTIATKDDVSIYYYLGDELSMKSPISIDMKIFKKSELVYQGLVPMSEELFLNLLDLLFPSDALIESISDHIIESEYKRGLLESDGISKLE